MDDLEKLLEKHQSENFEFSGNFCDAIMHTVNKIGLEAPKIIRLWEKRIWATAAACVVGVLISVYALDGTLSLDSVLGLSEHSSIEVSQSIETYNQWSLE